MWRIPSWARAPMVGVGALCALGGSARAGDWRPLYHFTPSSHWMNDPNGLVYLDGEYHLFFQYNPFGAQWGHMSWGHARSADLIHWRELPVAIPENRDYSIYSGSIVVDTHDTSGFGKRGRPPLVAVYTGARRAAGGGQSQQLAFSRDRGLTWTQYPGNPVLDLGLREFRDPQVFWYAPARRWIMVAVLADQHQVAFFASADLKHWNRTGVFGPSGAVDGAWECPDLLLLPVSDAPGEFRWLLKVDVFRSRASAGSGAQYFVGNFDGESFTPEPGNTAQPVDFGRDFYAAESWSHLAAPNAPVWIAWMNNHDYAKDIPTSPFRGSMSVPRVVSLRRAGRGHELVQAPVAQVETLRVQHRHLANLTVADRSAILAAEFPESAEIQATFTPGNSAEFGLVVRAGVDERTVIGYDVGAGRIFVDRSRSGRVDFNASFPGIQSAPLALEDGSLKLRVLLDRSSVEVFAGDGTRVFTEQIFPSPGSRALQAYARGGAATLRQADLWRLAP